VCFVNTTAIYALRLTAMGYFAINLMGDSLQAIVMTKALLIVCWIHHLGVYTLAWLCLLHGARRELSPVVYSAQAPRVRFILIYLLCIDPVV